jgi:hypothetical protein
LQKLKADGWNVWALSDKWVKGYPDLMVFRKDEIMFLEIKRPHGGVVSKLQQYNIDKLKDCGFIAKVITDVSQIYQ